VQQQQQQQQQQKERGSAAGSSVASPQGPHNGSWQFSWGGALGSPSSSNAAGAGSSCSPEQPPPNGGLLVDTAMFKQLTERNTGTRQSGAV
jgi:hypothetical protein